MMDFIRVFFSLLAFFTIVLSNAQQVSTDSILVELSSVEVHATRLSTNFQSSVLPVSLLKPGLTDNVGISLKPMIDGVPGVFVMNANNYAQDLRIAIRGFGARSAFGIRGIKIVVDGVPETTPDGQGQLDNLDLYMIDRLEVVRGAASSLYGNASGGVIYINSRNQVDTGFVELHSELGSYGLQRYDGVYGFSKHKFQAILHASHTKASGYRDQSGFENNVLHLGWGWEMKKDTRLSGTVNYTNAPVGDDPGGLKLADVEVDRRQAREANVLYKAGEAVTQIKGNIAFDKKLGDRSAIKLYGFGNSRTFVGRLPFEFGGLINLDRFYYGQGGHFTFKKISKNRVDNYLLGYDLAFQQDERKRFRNLEGAKGDQTLDQTEVFNNQAIYAIGKWTFSRWFAEQSFRIDFNQLKNIDHFLQNGDDSGLINLSNVNFSTGVGFFINSGLTLVGRYGTAFETPALSELSANPTGAGGFNEKFITSVICYAGVWCQGQLA
jgi:iron complex outermembrane receptor protein